MQASQGFRRGAVFSVRLTPSEREYAERLQSQVGGPRAIGAWMRWRALGGEPPPRQPGLVLPAPGAGNTGSGITSAIGAGVLPDLANFAGAVIPHQVCITGAGVDAVIPALDGRIILDLCGGSGSWSKLYRDAGYDVRLVTLPDHDVRLFVPPAGVWGVLAAPMCTEFSLAKNGQPRDFVKGMETVNACMRVILQCRPRWWALENPTGYLAQFLGTPADVWEPHDFGDSWTKRTAIWGDFQLPTRGPFVQPLGSAMDRNTAAERAITPPGFSRAFFEANP